MERACVTQGGTLRMMQEMTFQKEVIELKGKLGPFLHNAILLSSV